jgi:tripartite-type tricarboxylate transporter receptor subunit TctC
MKLISKVLLAAAFLAGNAQAAWPDKPIKLVVPYSAGGAADALARTVATELGHRLKQQVIVDNKPGAGGTIGAQAVATAPADGYTFLYDATSFAVNPSLFPKLPFDYAKDFQPVSMVARIPTLLVVPAASPFKSVADLVQYAKAHPAKLSYASAGNGGAAHLSGELFKQGFKIAIVHIPYRGGAPALTDLAGGQVDMMFSAVTASGPMVKGGRLRVLATAFDRRLESMPEIPTVSESGLKGFSAYEWNAIFSPAGAPAEAVKRMETEMRAVLATPAMQERLAALGALPAAGGAKELGEFVRAESAKWASVIKTSQIKID